MKCPDEVSDAVLKILNLTLLRIRILGSEGNASECQIEAYHTHNLPSLIKDYQHDLLTFYLDIERPQFIRESTRRNFAGFEPYWQNLEQFARENAKSISELKQN